MKKNILLTFMFITLFFIGNNDVLAELKCEVGDEGCTDSKIKENLTDEINKTYKKSRLACLYEVELNNGKKYYNYIFYSEEKDKIYGGTTFKSNNFLSFGGEGYQELKSDDNAWLLGNAYDGLYKQNQCPANSYIDESYTDEICFDNAGECKNIDHELNDNTDFNITKNSKLVGNFSEQLKYKGLTYKNSCESTALPAGYNKVCRYVDETTGNYALLLYNNTTNQIVYNKLKSGVRFIIDKGQTKMGSLSDVGSGNSAYSKYDDYTNNITDRITSCPSSLYLNEYEPSREELQRGINYYWELSAGNTTTRYKLYTCIDNSVIPQETPYDDCGQLLIDSGLQETVEEFMGIIRIFVPILLIGLITYDFARAVLAGADDKINKIRKRAIQRIIIAIVIFFVPTFINIVFNMVNEVWGTNFSTCGIAQNE